MHRAGRALIIIASVLLIGSGKSANVGGGYTITAPFSPDGQHHGNTLCYNGRRVIDNVGMQQLSPNGDILVFSEYVQEGDADGEQLFAVRGGGVPAMLSRRVVNRVRITAHRGAWLLHAARAPGPHAHRQWRAGEIRRRGG